MNIIIPSLFLWSTKGMSSHLWISNRETFNNCP